MSIIRGIESIRLQIPTLADTPESAARTKAIAKAVFISMAIAAGAAIVTASLGCGALAMGVSTLGISFGCKTLRSPIEDKNAVFDLEIWMARAFIIGSIALGCGIIMAPAGISLLSAGLQAGSFWSLFDGLAALAFTYCMTSLGKRLLLSPEEFFKNSYKRSLSMLKALEGQYNTHKKRKELLSNANRAMEHYSRLAIPHMPDKELQKHLSNNPEAQAWKCTVNYATEKQSKDVIFPFFNALAKEVSAAEKKYKAGDYIKHLKSHGTHEDVQKAIWQRKEDLFRTRASIACVKEMQSLLPTHLTESGNFFANLFAGKTVKPDLVSKLKKTIDQAEAKQISIEALNKKSEEIIEATPNADDIYTTDTITALGEVGFRVGDLQGIANLFNVAYGHPLLEKFSSAGLCTKADLLFAGILPTPGSNDKPTLAEIQNRLESHLHFRPKPIPWTTAQRVSHIAKKCFYFAIHLALFAASIARTPISTLIAFPFGWIVFETSYAQVKNTLTERFSIDFLADLEASPQTYTEILCDSIFKKSIEINFFPLNFAVSLRNGLMAPILLSWLRRRFSRLT